MRWSSEEYNEYLNRQAANKQQPSKYHSKKTWVDGICFDSKKEADFYINLKLLAKAGEIKGFCLQARFVLVEGIDQNNRATEYKADFVIFHNDNTFEIIDTKGLETPVFKLKMKEFRAKYPNLEIKIV